MCGRGERLESRTSTAQCEQERNLEQLEHLRQVARSGWRRPVDPAIVGFTPHQGDARGTRRKTSVNGRERPLKSSSRRDSPGIGTREHRKYQRQMPHFPRVDSVRRSDSEGSGRQAVQILGREQQT